VGRGCLPQAVWLTPCLAADDTKAKEKIEAKNSLENYAYSIRNTIRDEKLAGKLSAESKAKVSALRGSPFFSLKCFLLLSLFFPFFFFFLLSSLGRGGCQQHHFLAGEERHR
jgi:hypothetical protein